MVSSDLLYQQQELLFFLTKNQIKNFNLMLIIEDLTTL